MAVKNRVIYSVLTSGHFPDLERGVDPGHDGQDNEGQAREGGAADDSEPKDDLDHVPLRRS